MSITEEGRRQLAERFRLEAELDRLRKLARQAEEAMRKEEEERAALAASGRIFRCSICCDTGIEWTDEGRSSCTGATHEV